MFNLKQLIGAFALSVVSTMGMLAGVTAYDTLNNPIKRAKLKNKVKKIIHK